MGPIFLFISVDGAQSLRHARRMFYHQDAHPLLCFIR